MGRSRQYVLAGQLVILPYRGKSKTNEKLENKKSQLG